jgi:phage gp36-like protein
MAYIELQDLLDELGEDSLMQLTDNDRTGEINEPRVAKAIEYAQGVVDAYLRSRYSLPVPATPMVKKLCADLAIMHLYTGRASFDDGVYKVRKNASDDAIKLLTAINQGKAALDVPAIEETKESPATGDRILTNANKSKFTDTKLSGF